MYTAKINLGVCFAYFTAIVAMLTGSAHAVSVCKALHMKEGNQVSVEGTVVIRNDVLLVSENGCEIVVFINATEQGNCRNGGTVSVFGELYVEPVSALLLHDFEPGVRAAQVKCQ